VNLWKEIVDFEKAAEPISDVESDLNGMAFPSSVLNILISIWPLLWDLKYNISLFHGA